VKSPATRRAFFVPRHLHDDRIAASMIRACFEEGHKRKQT
jgi:hypothetical protein